MKTFRFFAKFPVKTLVLFSLFTIHVNYCFAQETIYVGGTYGVPAIWDADTVKVMGDIIIKNEVTITAGTVVELQGYFRIGVGPEDILNASGSKEDTIFFTIGDTTGFYRTDTTLGGWAGIRYGCCGTRLNLNYCKIQYVKMNPVITNFPYGGVANINNCIISNNNSSAISLNKGHINIYNSIIESNNGNGISNFENGKAVIIGNIIQNNNGIGISLHGDPCSGIIKGNIIRNNQGRGIGLQAQYLPVINNLIYNNKSGGINLSSSSSTLLNNTIVNNYANVGGGIFARNTGKHNIINCIVRNNISSDGRQIFGMWGSDTIFLGSVYNSNIDGISNLKVTGIKVNNIDEDPMFIDPANFDFHLSDYSPGINTGISDTTVIIHHRINTNFFPETDLDGNPRIIDGEVDMGAYENQKGYFRITKQPFAKKICAGDSIAFETFAIGGVTGYQWQKDGCDLSSSDTKILAFDTVKINDQGYYNCLISTLEGTKSTDTVHLSVNTDFTIESQTTSFSICPGNDTLLIVSVDGGNTLEYNWTKNGNPIPDETKSMLLVPSLTARQQDIYQCRVSNACGSLVTEEIIITASEVPAPPAVDDVDACEGQNEAVFTATGVNIRWYEPSDSIVDTRNNKKYATVRLGTQVWMAQNIDIGRQINSSENFANNQVIEKYCYGDNPENCNQYGGMYSWAEVMNYQAIEESQGICPSGWHIPSDADWKELEIYLGMTKDEMNALDKERGNRQGTELMQEGSTGFNVMPGGLYSEGYYFLGYVTSYWTSSQYDDNNALNRGFDINHDGIHRSPFSKNNAGYVRCIRDKSALVNQGSSYTLSIPENMTQYKVEVTQTPGGCESDTASAMLIVSPVPYPPVVSNIEICEEETLTDLIATGTNIKWYSDSLLTDMVHSGNNLKTNLTQPGIYIFYATQTILGCESLPAIATITIKPDIITEEYITICEGSNYMNWTETGIYSRAFESSSGCDSIVTTHLTVNPVYNIDENISVCEGESYKGWTATGEYERILTSSTGCDSVVTTNLIVNPLYNIIEEIRICKGENYLGWTETGQYNNIGFKAQLSQKKRQ